MPYTPSPTELAEALQDAGGLRLLRVTHLGGKQVVLTFDWQGQPLQVQATITEVLDGQIPDQPRRRNEQSHRLGGRNRERLYEQRLIEEDCRRLDYPLYYAEEWLRREKDRLGTFQAISDLYGYSTSTLSYAAQQFGWPPEKPAQPSKREQVRADWQAGGVTKSALAERYGVSIGSIFNWVKDLEVRRRGQGE